MGFANGSSGAPAKALFPRAWQYYDGVVATVGLVFITVNALIGVEVFSQSTQRWISVGVAVLQAILIWMRARATTLGVVKVNAEHLQPPKEEGGSANPEQRP